MSRQAPAVYGLFPGALPGIEILQQEVAAVLGIVHTTYPNDQKNRIKSTLVCIYIDRYGVVQSSEPLLTFSTAHLHCFALSTLIIETTCLHQMALYCRSILHLDPQGQLRATSDGLGNPPNAQRDFQRFVSKVLHLVIGLADHRVDPSEVHHGEHPH